MPHPDIKIFISTTEPSGDLYASMLVKALNKLVPAATFVGVGGERMQQAGVKLLYNSSGRGAVGIFETLGHIPSLYFAYKKAVHFITKEKPALAIFIDSQGFNMPLAKQANKAKVKTAYYVSPQEWLWGTERGINEVVNNVSLILSIFQQEHDAYKAHGGNSVFCGHPLLDAIGVNLSAPEIDKKLNLPASARVIGLFPGNRKQEISGIFPIMLDAAKIILKYVPEAVFIVPFFSSIYKPRIESEIKNSRLPIIIFDGFNHEAIKRAEVVLSTPGTVTLECSIIGTPALAIYRLNPLTYFIGKHILKIKLPYFTMPSLLAQKKVIPEFIQGDAVPERIANEAINYLTNQKYRVRTIDDFNLVKGKLGKPGSLICAAREIAKLLNS